MKKILPILFTLFICLIINLDNVYAREDYPYDGMINSNAITISCDVNKKTYTVSINGNKANLFSVRNGGSLVHETKILDSTFRPIDLGYKDIRELRYIDINDATKNEKYRLYIDPKLTEKFIEGDCYEFKIKTDGLTEIDTPSATVIGLAHYDPNLVEDTIPVAKYKLNCENYRNYSDFTNISTIDTNLYIYRDEAGYFLSIDNKRMDNTGEWYLNECFGKDDCSVQSAPHICGYSGSNIFLFGAIDSEIKGIDKVNDLNIYAYYDLDGKVFVFSTDSTKAQDGNYKLVGGLEKDDDKVLSDENTISCFYKSIDNADAFTIMYSPSYDSFDYSSKDGTFHANSSDDLVRGELKEQLKKGSCINQLYYCKERRNSDALFFTDKEEYTSKYIGNEDYHCVGALDEETFNEIYGKRVGVEKYYARLKNPLQVLEASALDYYISIDGNKVQLRTVVASNEVCSLDICKEDTERFVYTAIKGLKEHCDVVFDNYKKLNKDNRTLIDDCIGFIAFYEELVKNGILEDYTYGCEFITTDLGDKLVWVLDLLKIAGPILALGLGTLDFIKAVASGDSDKEMKTAFKRFSTRIIAAILLFLIPFILSFLMDIFLENQEGYNSDNPFCNLVEWEE